MSSAFHEDVSPVAFLVYDACEDSIIVEPRRRRPLTKALNTSESRVLNRK